MIKSLLAAINIIAFTSTIFLTYFLHLFLLTENNNTTNNNNNNNSSSTEHESGSKDLRDSGRDKEKDRSRSDKEREKNPSSDSKANSTSPKRPTSREFPPEREKNWNYPPGLDNIALATGAFWQNYSGKLHFFIAQQINSTPAKHLFQPLIRNKKSETMEKIIYE